MFKNLAGWGQADATSYKKNSILLYYYTIL